MVSPGVTAGSRLNLLISDLDEETECTPGKPLRNVCAH